MKTRDLDIRNVLHRQLNAEHKYEPDTLILDEMAICQGESRIDVAVINGSIHGYEIKSDRDNLDRLPIQMDYYNQVFDTMTIITGEFHLDKVNKIIPEWWGIMQVSVNEDEEIILSTVRETGINKEINPYSLVQLLWKEEAIELLTIYGLQRGYLSKSKKKIWERIVETISFPEIHSYVRSQLKTRSNWRSV